MCWSARIVSATWEEVTEQFVTAVNSIMWSLPMVVGLLALGLYFTIRMAAPQVRLLTDMVGQLARGGSSSG